MCNIMQLLCNYITYIWYPDISVRFLKQLESAHPAMPCNALQCPAMQKQLVLWLRLNVIRWHVVNDKIQLRPRLCLPPQSPSGLYQLINHDKSEIKCHKVFKLDKGYNSSGIFCTFWSCLRSSQRFKSKLDAVRMIFWILGRFILWGPLLNGHNMSQLEASPLYKICSLVRGLSLRWKKPACVDIAPTATWVFDTFPEKDLSISKASDTLQTRGLWLNICQYGSI
jgi:hypothetical protein